MDDEKLQNELLLALSLSKQQLENSSLDSGYDAEENQWKLIMLYRDNIEELYSIPGIQIILLHSNFAIVHISTDQIPALIAYPQVLYLEQAKPVFINVINGISQSCLPVDSAGLVMGRTVTLTGENTAVAIVDSGVDYRHPDFLNEDGTTRILTYWDQSLPYDDTNPYKLGTVFTEEELNELLKSPAGSMRRPSEDTSGHGTHIAGICAGNGNGSSGRNKGVAPKASMIVVKVRNEARSIYSDYANIMMAVDFSLAFAKARNIPLSVNISYGSNDGSHQGDSLIELYLRQSQFVSKNTIVCATGNEGITARHTQGQISPGETKEVLFSIGNNEPNVYLQLWTAYATPVKIELLSPGISETFMPGNQPARIYGERLGTNLVKFILGSPTPFRTLQSYFLSMQSGGANTFLTPGTWRLRITSLANILCTVYLWLPVREATTPDTRFLDPVTVGSFTIPSTATSVISVGGYDSTTDTLASFSGQGYALNFSSKPDICAPAVNILSTAPGGGYSIKSGTSMAAPFVTGASALLMEEGIVNGRDPYLYGSKVKAFLQRGARRLPGFLEYPNPQVGYGALCVRESLPGKI